MMTSTYTRVFAFRASIIAIFLVGLATLLRLWHVASLPFLEEEQASFASYLADTAFAVSVIVTLIGSSHLLSKETNTHLSRLNPLMRILTYVSIAVTVGLVYLFTSVFFLSILDSFIVFSPSPSWVVILINGLYGGLVAYHTAFTSARLGALRLITLTGGVMLVGLFSAILLSTNLDWWTQAISVLGVDEYGLVFNMTFILSGLLLVAVLQDKMGDLEILRQRGIFNAPYLHRLRNAMILMCITLAGVGFFPLKEGTSLIHQVTAFSALALFLVIPITSWRIVPIYPQSYRTITIVILALSLMICIAYYFLRIISFSVAELMLLFLGAVWLIAFYSYTRSFILIHDASLVSMAE